MQNHLLDQADELLKLYKKEIIELLTINKDKLEKLAQALMKKQTLSKAEINEIAHGKKD
jgi:ATP-dependent Zn protease